MTRRSTRKTTAAKAEHPAWCAQETGPADRDGHSHRSRTVQFAHGAYGDSTTRVYVHEGDSRFAVGPRVNIVEWSGGFDPMPDPDKDTPDSHLSYSVGDTALLVGVLGAIVEGATEPSMAPQEALARLSNARRLLARFMSAKRIRPDGARRYSPDDQQHALVPMELVAQLAAVLDPGTYPYVDPWDDLDDDEQVAVS